MSFAVVLEVSMVTLWSVEVKVGIGVVTPDLFLIWFS